MIEITCVCRDSSRNITHIGDKNNNVWCIEDACNAIKYKQTRFYVAYEGKTVDIKSVEDCHHLITEQDETVRNNLGKLKDCKKCD